MIEELTERTKLVTMMNTTGAHQMPPDDASRKPTRATLAKHLLIGGLAGTCRRRRIFTTDTLVASE